ncbi:multicopper oxidase domain-containing protein [Mobilicoccus massiliensis]|uniref:multicopper oxidase domain-containing protein n=1 Tax=Mobilicoccus massiliensis TaxID=1522310 RepID=UPI000BB30EB7|nr:multicopper oxidase domain-containing protein [Mobilicoccus massiliensis]
MPSTYSAMHMGYADYGTPGPSAAAGAGHGPGPGANQGHTAGSAHGIPVTELLGDRSARPDVSYTLVVRREHTTLADGRTFDGYTVNGSTPGPTLEARRGQLVEVVLRNDNVAKGTTLHWHGLDVPSGEDGVAGVTQNAVGPGQQHVYRFRPKQEVTFWYHSHQVSHAQVVGGLLGGIVIHPWIAPGRVEGLISPGGWSHACTEEVPRRVA